MARLVLKGTDKVLGVRYGNMQPSAAAHKCVPLISLLLPPDRMQIHMRYKILIAMRFWNGVPHA